METGEGRVAGPGVARLSACPSGGANFLTAALEENLMHFFFPLVHQG